MDKEGDKIKGTVPDNDEIIYVLTKKNDVGYVRVVFMNVMGLPKTHSKVGL